MAIGLLRGGGRSIRRASRTGVAWSLAALLFAVATSSATAEARPDSEGDAADPVLSDRLFDNITGLNWQFDTSYDVFLPWTQLPPTDESCTPDAAQSLNAVKQLIWRGADSIPLLLAHLDDDRPTQQLVTGRAFRDGLPFNPESRFGIPFGTSLGSTWNPRLAQRRDVPFFAIPVGDIAFETLGQIVNRPYKYLGSEGPDHLQTMTSPVLSDKLRLQVKKEWGGLTRASHCERLIDDFQNADRAALREGAYLRLAFYYPDALDRVVPAELLRPVFDHYAVDTFFRESLGKEADSGARRVRIEEFANRHGPAFMDGLVHRLFDDLEKQEAWERDELREFLQFPFRAREVLVGELGFPANVRSADRPRRRFASSEERGRLISRMVHDKRPQVTAAIRRLYASEPRNPLFAPAALRGLANRGCEDVLLAELASIDPLVDPPQWPSLVRLQAIATSKAPGVQERLKQFVRLSKHPQTFMCAVPRQRDRSWDSLVAERAAQLLRDLPENSRDGGTLLHMFLETECEQIALVVGNYLKTSNPDRAVEVCGHYASGRSVPRELLIPFLEDQSPARNYYPRQTVRERVALSLGGRLPGFQFQLQWSGEAKDKAIQQLKTRLEPTARTETNSAADSSR